MQLPNGPTPWLRRAIGFASLLALAAQADGAMAAGTCERDHLMSQELREKGAFRAAHEALLRCAVRTCPGLVQADCAKWLEQVNADMPTVVPSARTGAGDELQDVRVRSEAGIVTETLEGKAIALDPGPHSFVFETDGRPPVEVRFVAKTGTKNAPVVAIFRDEAAEETETQPATIAIFTLLAVGTAAFVTFGGLAIGGEIQFQDLEDSCAPRCDPDDVDDVRAVFVGADVALALSAAALGSALVVYLVVPEEAGGLFAESGFTRRSLSVGVAPSADGAVGSVLLTW
jgi:hypothetical protein